MPFTRSVPLTLWLIPIWTEVNLPGMPKFNGAYEIKLLQNVNESIRTETYMQRGNSWRTKRYLQVTIQNEDATRKNKSKIDIVNWGLELQRFRNLCASKSFESVTHNREFHTSWKRYILKYQVYENVIEEKKTEETSRKERSANQRCSLSSGFCPEILVLWWLDYREPSVVVW